MKKVKDINVPKPYIVDEDNTSNFILNEPSLMYNSSAHSNSGFMAHLFASNNTPSLIKATRKGLTKAHIISLAATLSITMDKMCTILNTTHRTIQRRTDTEHLEVGISEQILEISEIFEKAKSVFNNLSHTTLWFKAPVVALGGETPLNLLDTSYGRKWVLGTLGQLEHGIYA